MIGARVSKTLIVTLSQSEARLIKTALVVLPVNDELRTEVLALRKRLSDLGVFSADEYSFDKDGALQRPTPQGGV